MITLNTEVLKSATLLAEKGAGKNVLLPITGMLGIKVISNTLYLCTKDGTNDFQVIIKDVTNEDVSITVRVETFAKLMAKVTSNTTTLDVDGQTLIIKANGNYKIPLEVDETGLVDFPSINFNHVGVKKQELEVSLLRNIQNTNKASMLKTYELPYLTGYYLGDSVITTDNETATFNAVQTVSEPLLLNANMMALLAQSTKEKVKLFRKGDQLYFCNDEMVVFGPAMAGLADFPVAELNQFLAQEFPSTCKISKLLLLSALDRVQLFVDTYDENAVSFEFGAQGLTVTSKSSGAKEVIDYISNNGADFTCLLHLPAMKELLHSNPADVVEISYGNGSAIKVTAESVSHVISQMGTDSEEE